MPEATTRNHVPADDNTPVIELEALTLDEHDVPRLSDAGQGVLKACYWYFVGCAKRGDWTEANVLLEDMRAKRVLPREAAQFRVLCDWLRWTGWYEQTRAQVSTWKGLVEELKSQDLSDDGLSEDLKTTCPLVVEQLENAFWSALDESFRGFLKHLEDRSWSDAMVQLEMLKTELLAPLSGLFEDVQILLPDGRGVLGWVEQALIAYSALEESCTATLAQLKKEPFPPDFSLLRRLETRQMEQQRRIEAVRRFLQVLREIAPRCGGEKGAARQLLDRFELVRITGESEDDVPDLDRGLKLLELWNAALDELSSTAVGGERLVRVLQHLDQVAESFSKASEQAHLVRSWGERQQQLVAYQARLSEGAGWQEDPEPMGNLAIVLGELRDRLALPWLESLEQASKAAQPRHKRIQAWSEALNSEQRRAAREGRIVDALRLLRTSTPEIANAVLEELAGESSTPDVTPWIRLSEALTRLQSDFDSVLALRIESATEPRFGFEHLEIPEDRLAEVSQRCEEAGNLLAEARAKERMLAAFDLPALEAIRTHLDELGHDRQLWAKTREALAKPALTEAHTRLVELAGRFPAAQGALDVVAAWRKTGKLRSGWQQQMTQENWETAAERIEAARRQYEETREQIGTFGRTTLTQVLDQRLAQLDEEREECQLALADEELLEQALGMLKSGRISDALGVFSEMKADLDSVRLWHEAVEAVAELNVLVVANSPCFESLRSPSTAAAEESLQPESST